MPEDPKKLIDFIERNNLGYILGRVMVAVVRAAESSDEEQLAHLKEARNLLNIMIKKRTRKA
jgi:cytosine/adenosine deaminase-related metal-dependent hydrolase